MDYAAILERLREYYANLLIIQYHNKPKAIATIKSLVNLICADMSIMQIRDAFDWRSAIGIQLDIIGAWVGVDRFYYGSLSDLRAWFALIDWNKIGNSLQGGFSNYNNFESLLGGFIDYDGLQPVYNRLNDDLFRQIIGLKIIKNSISFTCKNIDNAIWEYFQGQVYTTWDLEERTLTYNYPLSLVQLMYVASKKDVLPCPPTVNLLLEEI